MQLQAGLLVASMPTVRRQVSNGGKSSSIVHTFVVCKLLRAWPDLVCRLVSVLWYLLSALGDLCRKTNLLSLNEDLPESCVMMVVVGMLLRVHKRLKVAGCLIKPDPQAYLGSPAYL